MALGRNRYVYILFTLMAFFCGLIWTFTNLGYDGEYQIAMSYRMLNGDKMFLEMWEPHQTSAFLPTALMWVYTALFHTTTGIVVYLQICGILIRGGLACLLYRTLRNDLGKSLSYGIGLFYFMVSPKDYALPEFSNMQLWYSTLLFCGLLAYLRSQKIYLLILSAVCLCLEALAYPSCVIVYFGGALILAFYSVHKRRDILIFTGVCAGLGLAFLCYFLSTIGPDVFMECLTGMLALEPTHTVSGISKIMSYAKEILEILFILLTAGIIGFGISLFPRYIRKNAAMKQPMSAYWLLCCAILMLAGFFMNIISAENRGAYSLIFLGLAGIGFRNRKSLEGHEKQIYVCGSLIGGLGFLATLILTDLYIMASIPYGLLAVAVTLIPIRKQVEKGCTGAVRKGFYVSFFCFMALFAFRCFYIRTPLSGKGQICSIFSDMSIVRTGPASGIISDANGVCIQRDSYPEWNDYIRPGDKVWIVGGVVDTLGYLYKDVEVAAPSTISTPSYNDALLEYWRLNPHKYPDVIVAECYLGNLSYDILANEWLLHWIEEEYQPEYVIEGVYWNYYFRTAP